MDLIRKCFLLGAAAAFSLIPMSSFASSPIKELIVHNNLPYDSMLETTRMTEGKGELIRSLETKQISRSKIMCDSLNPCEVFVYIIVKEKVKIGKLSLYSSTKMDKDKALIIVVDNDSPYEMKTSRNELFLNEKQQ